MLLKTTFFYLLLLPLTANGQRDSLYAKVYRSSNSKDKLTVFMVNESVPMPTNKETTYSITITVTNIRNKNGVIRFKFYDETTPFPHDKGFLRIVVPKSEIVDGSYTATYQGFASKVMGVFKHKFDKYDVIFIENDRFKSRLVSFQREDILMVIEFIFG